MDTLKKQARQLLALCDQLQSRGVIYQNQPITLRECMSSEWLYYLLSLSCGKGVTAKERDFICDISNVTYTISQLDEFYTRYRLDSLEFREKIPRALQEFVRMDLLNRLNGKHTTFGQLAANFYQYLGQSFVACDTSTDDALQLCRLTNFCANLQKFLSRHDVSAFSRNKAGDAGLGADSHSADNASAAADLQKAAAPALNPGRIDEILADLNALVGLEEVKREIGSLINLLRINQIRRERGLPQVFTSLHMVFSGNPGTGKTTVARMLAEIYYQLGVLKKNLLVEVDRSGLVSGYVGQTAIKSKEVITSALDGVLFIDEAYTLTSGKGQNDFGQEAVDTLLKMMEDNRSRLVVIAAGYLDEMEDFLQSNPGLKSRFNKFIRFDNYKPDELTSIFVSMCERQRFSLSDNAKKAVREYFEARLASGEKHFANAREARNLYEAAVMRQANRLAGQKKADETLILTDEQLVLIEKEDITDEKEEEKT